MRFYLPTAYTMQKIMHSQIKRVVVISGLFCSGNALSSGLSLDWDWMISSQTTEMRNTAFQSRSDEEHYESINGVLDVQVIYKNVSALVAVKGTNLYHSESSQHSDAEIIISELFWQESFDIFDMPLDLQLGKVRLDWGVGYGYRPLDIFTPYRRNPVGIQVEEGAGVASVSYFDDQGEWTLLYTDSSWQQQDTHELEERNEQQGAGVRRYGLVGDTEYQWLVYYDDVREGMLGASLVTVLYSAWEIHASALYQHKYLNYQPSNFVYLPTTLQEKENAYQTLVGLTWANEFGHNLIVEYWYDSRAWSNSEWDNVLSNPLPQNQNGYSHSNTVQHNMLFHWSLDSSAWSHWQWSQNTWLQDITPTTDILYSPADGGVIATQWIHYLLRDSGESSIELELAARFLTGKSHSAYANLIDKHMILFNIKGRF